MMNSSERDACVATLVDAAGETGMVDVETGPTREQVRSLVAITAQGLHSDEDWLPDRKLVHEHSYAAAYVADLVASIAAEDADERYTLVELSRILHYGAWDGDDGDWFGALAGYELWVGPMSPHRADDLVLLLGLPDDCTRDTILRAACAFAKACALARVDLEVARANAEDNDEVVALELIAGIFGALEHDAAHDSVFGAAPADGRYTYARTLSAAMQALAGALDEPADTSSLRADIARILRGDDPLHDDLVGPGSLPTLDAIITLCQEAAAAWPNDDEHRNWRRLAYATAEHCNMVAYFAESRKGGYTEFSRTAAAPLPPDPAMEIVADAVFPLSRAAWTHAKNAWVQGCALAASALAGFAARARTPAERDTLLLATRMMARRALAVGESEVRLADFSYTPLL